MLIDLLRNIDMIQAIILIAGLALVIVEMFTPGFGVPGIAGGLLLIVGIILTARNFIEALVLFIVILVILGTALFIVLRSAARGRLKKRLVLDLSQKNENGYVGTRDFKEYIGREGIALTVLRPAGAAEFDGVRIDVVSEGPFINPGTHVKVIKVEGPRVVVSPVKTYAENVNNANN